MPCSSYLTFTGDNGGQEKAVGGKQQAQAERASVRATNREATRLAPHLNGL